MRRLGSIQCIEVPADAGTSESEKRTIILFHGFGADAYDLQTLSDALPTPWPVDFLFPQGPLEVPIGPGWTGRAWWKIDMLALQAAGTRGDGVDISNEDPAGLATVRPQIMKMLDQLGVPWSRLILGGFSQGAMLATDIFLRAPENPAGLIIMSGNLICQNAWKELAPKRAGCSFFQSHGKGDAVLGYKGAARLETLLTQAGLKGSLQGFNGGHEIPMQTLQGVGQYLKQLK